MFVELHIIQNFAPSCLNRDESNIPKDCTFGNVRRARISSQCLKRATRWHRKFAETVGHDPSLLTKKAKKELIRGLAEHHCDTTAVDTALDRFLANVLLPISAGQTNVQLFLGIDELELMTNRLVEKWDALVELAEYLALSRPANDKAKQQEIDAQSSKLIKKLTEGLRIRTRAADVALFGRMIADKPDLEKDAACQVSHAISTHRVDMSDDFYTAVDDLKVPGEEQGASMMGHIDFNSSCYYRFAVIDTGQLLTNVAGDPRNLTSEDRDLCKRAIEGFIKASVAAIPSGKQNSFAALNAPSLVFVVVRENGMPWAMHNAFERPIRVNPNTYDSSDEESLSSKSIVRLDQYHGKLKEVYGNNGEVFAEGCYVGLESPDLRNINLIDRFETLISNTMKAIKL
ncbi:MAG: type I-E CRISPR-associated protein Cas7/Cse4/CasC [bacterium]|nr:type I-E CRISPR-associated protein Cas7/Cse4/CasC [bacterium]